MVTIRIKGGLGNQLFQYASGYALAQRLNQPITLDYSFFSTQTLRGFKLGNFRLPEAITMTTDKQFPIVELLKGRCVNKAVRQLNRRVITCGKSDYLLETKSDLVPEFYTLNSENIYMDGYFQSELYFLNYRQTLLQQLQPNYEFDQAVKKIMDEVEKCNSVAVHVRRGDFLKVQNNRNPRLYLLPEDYYQNALNYIGNQIENPQYYWFSDDINWVKRSFGEKENFHFVSLSTPYPDIDEMMLMKTCKNTIAANSTFSWWASWLNTYNRAIRIVPEKRYGNKKMIPSDWVKIPILKSNKTF